MNRVERAGVVSLVTLLACAAEPLSPLPSPSPSSPPSPSGTAISGTIETEFAPLDGSPHKTRPRDLSQEQLVIYTLAGQRVPADGVFHGTVTGQFRTGESVPDGPFVLRIGDQRYEVLDTHEVHIVDHVAGDPDLVTSPVPTPIHVDVVLDSPWIAGDSLVAVAPLIAFSHPALELELDPPPAPGQLRITGTFDWASLPGPALNPFDPLVLRHMRTTMTDAPNPVVSIVEIGEITVFANAASGVMTAVDPPGALGLVIDHEGLAAQFPGDPASPDPSRWAFDLEKERFAPFLFDQVVVDGAPDDVVIAPKFSADLTVHARYIQPRTLHVDGGELPVFEMLAEVLPIDRLTAVYRLRPGPTIASVTLDGTDPDGLEITARDITTIHVDIPDVAAGATDVSVMFRKLHGTPPRFAVHGLTPDLLVPAEALGAGDYVFRVDVTVGDDRSPTGEKITSRWFGPTTFR